MLSHENRRTLLQIIPFGVICLIYSIVYSLLEKGILGNNPFYPSTGNPYKFRLVIPAIISMLLGILIGYFEVLYLNKWFQKWSFTKKIITKTAIYLLIATIAILIVTIISNAIALGISPIDREMRNIISPFLFNFAFGSFILYSSLVIITYLFYLEISDNIGQSVLLNFFTGKYHQPIEEERVYMFLDMNSSTTIAEQLGHVQYFKMLKEYYVDLTAPIIRFGGEIYQYVGDEVIVTWKLKKGIANDALNCFLAMKEALNSQSRKYQSIYGLIPTFKTGIHLGEVTTGEIGVIKKEITFSGNVLNTTARIRGLCKIYNVDLLASEEFVQALETNGTFRLIELGEAELRGKNEKVNLFTITESLHNQVDSREQ